jgi:recombinase-like zinc beta ribbon protein
VRKNRGWSRPFLKNLILSDLYRPHTVEELREMGVSEAVLAGLDAERLYGVYRYDDIPVPVPASGIDLATVEAARANVQSKRASQRKPSRAGGRTWELSEGTLRCGECERAMQTEVASPRGKPYFYYRCVGVKQGKADRCQLRTHYRAEEVEAGVWDSVQGLYGDKELLQRRTREEFARKRAELSGPSVDVQRLKERLDTLDRE